MTQPLAPQTPLNDDNNPPQSIAYGVGSDQERQARYDAVPAVMDTKGAPLEDVSGTAQNAMGDSASRQAESQAGLDSPAGSGEFNVLAGSAPDWPTNMPGLS